MLRAFRSFTRGRGSGVSSRVSPSRGKQTFTKKMMRDIMFGGFVCVGGMTYYVKESTPLYNAQQEHLKKVAQAIKQIKQQQQAIKEQAIKEQAKASAGPEEFK